MRLSEILHINIQSSIELSYFSPTYVFERGAVYLSYFYFCVISHNCKNLHFQILYDIRKTCSFTKWLYKERRGPAQITSSISSSSFSPSACSSFSLPSSSLSPNLAALSASLNLLYSGFNTHFEV